MLRARRCKYRSTGVCSHVHRYTVPIQVAMCAFIGLQYYYCWLADPNIPTPKIQEVKTKCTRKVVSGFSFSLVVWQEQEWDEVCVLLYLCTVDASRM